jgi:glutamyl-Q tRNA(Asp) synthetase
VIGATGPAAPPRYVGRFAPSPTGPLHAGSLVAALASWLDARAHGGRWLVRIEDTDTPRCQPGAAETILRQLADCGLLPDEPPWWQSRRGDAYRAALDSLLDRGAAYACACSRADVEAALDARGTPHRRGTALAYPGTCRGGTQGRPARAWRLHTGVLMPNGPPASAAHRGVAINTGAIVEWRDRRLGQQRQAVEAEVGDFALLRADGIWAYQLAVVVDDGAQGVTDVVRGEDLADNTARQILLQRALGLPTPRYLHTPLVRDPRGDKLSKQHGAPAADTSDPVAALGAAANVLSLPPAAGTLAERLAAWVRAWGDSYNLAP